MYVIADLPNNVRDGTGHGDQRGQFNACETVVPVTVGEMDAALATVVAYRRPATEHVVER